MSDARDVLQEAYDFCRRAHELAERHGERADWADLPARLEATLARQKKRLRAIDAEEGRNPMPAAY